MATLTTGPANRFPEMPPPRILRAIKSSIFKIAEVCSKSSKKALTTKVHKGISPSRTKANKLRWCGFLCEKPSGNPHPLIADIFSAYLRALRG